MTDGSTYGESASLLLVSRQGCHIDCQPRYKKTVAETWLIISRLVDMFILKYECGFILKCDFENVEVLGMSVVLYISVSVSCSLFRDIKGSLDCCLEISPIIVTVLR